MANKNFFVDGGTVQVQEGAIYLRRTADDELLSLCRAKTFAYVLTARQMGKSSLMVNTEMRLAAEGTRTVEIDLNRIGVKLTKEQWYLGILYEVQSQLGLQQDIIEWWLAPQRQELGTTQRLLLFFEQVLLVEISEPVILFVDEIETTLRLDFTDDFFAAIRSVHNARSSRRFERLAFVLIGAATPDSLIRDPQLTPFNIGQSVMLSDFTVEEVLPLADGFGLPQEEAKRILRRLLYWSGGHPYLTQRLCRAIVSEKKSTWTDGDVDEVVARVFFDDQRDIDKNLRFVRDMLLASDLNQEEVLATYRDILREGRPVLDDERALIKSHLKLSGVVTRQGTVLHVRNPIYREVFNESWVKNNIPINWTRRLTRVAAAVFLAVLLFSTILAPYAWSQKLKAEVALQNEKRIGQELQQTNKKLEETVQQLREAKNEAEKQSEKAQVAAQQEKLAKEEAEIQRALALSERDRAHLSERDRAQAQRSSYIGKLIAIDQSLRGAHSLPERVVVAKEAFLQAREAEAVMRDSQGDIPLSALAYQNLIEGAMLLPRSTAIPFAGDLIDNVMLAKNGQKIMGFDREGKTFQAWDLTSRQVSAREVGGSGRILQYRSDGKYVARGEDGVIIIRELENGRELKVVRAVPADTLFLPIVKFSSVDDYALICSCLRNPSYLGTFELWQLKSGQKIADIAELEEAVVLDFTSDGKFIYLANKAGNVQVFDTQTGQPIVNKVEPKESLETETSVEEAQANRSEPGTPGDETKFGAFSENMNFLVTANSGSVGIWDLSNPRAIRRTAVVLGNSQPSLRRGGLAISNNGRFFTMFGDTTSTINIRAVHSSSVRSINTPDATNYAFFSANGRDLITVSNASFHVWDIQSGVEVYRGVDDRSDFEQVVPGLDENSLVTVNEDGLARLWDITTDERSIRKLIPFSAGPTDISVDREFLVTIGPDKIPPDKSSETLRDQTAEVWEMRTGHIIATRKFESEVKRMIFSHGGEEIVVMTSEGKTYTVWIWPWKKGSNVSKLATFTASSLEQISCGKRYLGALIKEAEPSILIWDMTRPGAASQQRTLTAQGARSFFFTPITDRLVVTTDHGTQLWDALNDRPIGGIIGFSSGDKKANRRVVYSDNGAYIANFSENKKSVEIAETATGEIVARLPHPKGVRSFDINANGDLMVIAGDEDDIIRLWAWKERPFVLSQVKSSVNSVTFSPTGEYFVSTARDDAVRVWDFSRPGAINEVARIQTGTGAVDAMFSLDSKYFYTVKEPLIQSWHWQPDQLVCEATSRLIKKDLSLKDWGEKYVLPREREFLDAQHRSVIGCGVVAPRAQK
jgi:WD40 repeat protein